MTHTAWIPPMPAPGTLPGHAPQGGLASEPPAPRHAPGTPQAASDTQVPSDTQQQRTDDDSTEQPLVGTTMGLPLMRRRATGEASALHMPVNVRSMSLLVLTIFASLFVLHWAKAVFIPFMLGLLMSYALSPIVNWAELYRVPRWLGAGVLLTLMLGSLGGGAYALSDEATKFVETLPAAAQKVTQTLRDRQSRAAGPLDSVQKAAAQIEQAAQSGATVNNRGALRVVVEPARFNVKDYLWPGTLGLAALVGQATIVVFLTYFLMVSGDSFRRKLIKLAGPSLSTKKITLQALHEITGQIQRYLQVQLLVSLLVGVLTGIAFAALGVDNAAVWGIAAAVLNLIPYVGSVITAGAAALVGFLQFGSLNMAIAISGASLLIHTIVGNLITPWLTGRASSMSPVAIFVALLAWGWLWGVWGLLLGIPIMMIVKSVCDRIDELKPVGEFLGA